MLLKFANGPANATTLFGRITMLSSERFDWTEHPAFLLGIICIDFMRDKTPQIEPVYFYCEAANRRAPCTTYKVPSQ
jgi:hypothetical protein